MRYVKKPVVIEAFQLTKERRRDNSKWPEWMHAAWNKGAGKVGAIWPKEFPNSDGTDELVIGSLEGNLTVTWNDWVIRDVKGEMYPCKPDIFELTYDRAE